MARNARKWNGRWLSALCVVACPLVGCEGCDMLMCTRSSQMYVVFLPPPYLPKRKAQALGADQ